MIKIFRYLKQYWWMVVVAVIVLFGQAMCDLNLPKLMANIVNNGIMTQNMTYIWQEGGIMLLITALSCAFTIVASFMLCRSASGLARTVRRAVFVKVTHYSSEEMNKLGTATLITRTTNDITQVQQFVVMCRIMVYAPFLAVGGVIMAYTTCAPLTWIMWIVIGVIVIIMLFAYFFLVPLFRSMQKKIDKVNLVLREALTGVRVIRAFNKEAHETKRFEGANTDLTNTSRKAGWIMSVLFPLMMLVMNFASLAIVWIGGHKLDPTLASHINVGDMMAFIQYAFQVLFGFMMVSMIFMFMPRASASCTRLNEILDSKNEITDPQNPVTPSDDVKGTVEFKDVVFRFTGAEEPVLRNISFTAKPGQTTAIIGGTGSGKSTLIDLIPRFYDIESGQILLDGVDIRQMTLKDLRGRISYVPQQAVLFSGTIADNIRFGNLDATDDEIKHAAAIAQATDFIEEKDEKFDSELAQGGTNVSGGQKQRLSIARAIARHPEIYIFDDSFSALDFKTDANLRAALAGETKQAAVLIIAQRVSTIMNADQIIVLDEGEVQGIGTHQELYENCEVYREIVLSQLSKEEIA